jgi:hypothetical protein
LKSSGNWRLPKAYEDPRPSPERLGVETVAEPTRSSFPPSSHDELRRCR